ncbi:phenylacetic acid degradation protein PaaD [Endozoicomonas sp. OPT23]|uniref:hydroxyphenylacetyl-CoA thioesterase PaaI n=1 Tax=Endozoicomonas sp. OPT23 TaxID=2072845 RepID=UPI00129A52C0|nr:hydroxyphenylacetyl-CoA thioesterase PaaI [Endozoicomonas sp. OPT23]MRI33621.1 phenylacetic acid degradation protein PaaD [Endozoicomonas sp. OPT23]
MVNSNSTEDARRLAEQCAETMFAEDLVSQNLGMKIEQVSPGCSVVVMEVRQDMVNGHDTCHGGMIFSLADSAFAFACNSFNEVAVAAHCSIDFIRPAFRGDLLTAKASVVYQGKRTGIYEISVFNQDDKLIARFQGNSARLNKPVVSQ